MGLLEGGGGYIICSSPLPSYQKQCHRSAIPNKPLIMTPVSAVTRSMNISAGCFQKDSGILSWLPGFSIKQAACIWSAGIKRVFIQTTLANRENSNSTDSNKAYKCMIDCSHVIGGDKVVTCPGVSSVVCRSSQRRCTTRVQLRVMLFWIKLPYCVAFVSSLFM